MCDASLSGARPDAQGFEDPHPFSLEFATADLVGLIGSTEPGELLPQSLLVGGNNLGIGRLTRFLLLPLRFSLVLAGFLSSSLQRGLTSFSQNAALETMLLRRRSA